MSCRCVCVAEAQHVAQMFALCGYLFPVDDHSLAVRAENTVYYRFQTPHLWPSRSDPPENMDYGVLPHSRAVSRCSVT